QRKIERRVDADYVPVSRRAASNKLSDALLIVVNLAECEKVLLADAETILAHGVPERQGKIRVQVFERVDSKAVDIEFAEQVLVTSDEDLTKLRVCRQHLLQRLEVAHGLDGSSSALPTEESITPKLVRRNRLAIADGIAAPSAEAVEFPS